MFRCFILATLCLVGSSVSSAWAQVVPEYIDSDAGQGQGLRIKLHSSPVAQDNYDRWDVLVTADHLISGDRIITTSASGGREIFELAVRIPEVDVAMGYKAWRRGTFENVGYASVNYVPVAQLKGMIGNRVYAARIGSRAGGFETFPLLIKAVNEDHLIVEAASNQDMLLQSDSGMSIWDSTVSLSPAGEIQGQPKLVGFVKGSGSDGVIVTPAEIASKALYQSTMPFSPDLVSDSKLAGAKVQLGGASNGRGGYEPEGSFRVKEGEPNTRFFNMHDGRDFTVELDVGDEDRIIEGFSFDMKLEGFGFKAAKINQFRPGDGGDWSEIGVQCDRPPRNQWSTVNCSFNRTVIARGVRINFNELPPNVKNITLH